MRKIGLIAGGGQFPLLFSKACREKEILVFAAAFINEASTDLSHYVDGIEWLHLGQINRLVKFFKSNGVSEAVLLGTVKKTNIFKDIKPDFKALALIARIKNTHDDAILRAFADALEREGITIKESTILLPGLIAPKGCWTKKKPGKAEKIDISIGWKIARQIGKLDIGQCLVICNGTVLAVEAVEGTDAAIKRGAGFAKGNAVVIKLAKTGQDLRFDLPASGLTTLESMVKAGASVLVLEAGKSLAFDRHEMIRFADRHGLIILALDDEDAGALQ